MEEQSQIAHFAISGTVGIDRAISAAKSEINLLDAYRTRLIADAVTGKFDVRAAAAKLPELRDVEALELDDEDDEADATDDAGFEEEAAA